jgi:hypothetical protein
MFRRSRISALAVAILAFALAVGGGDSKASPAGAKGFQRLAAVSGTTAGAVAMARTANGVLHLVYQTYSGRSASGLGSLSISPAGNPGPQVQALTGWPAGMPGLLALPNGTLQAVFGAISPGNVPSVWAISSGNGGSSWSAPADVRGGGPNEPLAYGSDISAAMAGSSAVVTLPQAGNLVVQTGLGAGSPSHQVTNGNDGSMTDADVAVDAATGEVVASWSSIAHDPTLYLQGVAPSVGSLTKVPGQSRNALVIAGRDTGPGVFGAYTSDGTHVRLIRYPGGSVTVGSRQGTGAKVLGVATGISGRVWVMWGDDSGGGVAVTRSNKAVTHFEPIQHVDLKALSLYRIQGDGRLGPLDLLVDAIPSSTGPAPAAGLYHARVLPVLSATTALTTLKKTDTLTVHVTDAGDAVAGAKVSVNGHTAATNSGGVAKLTFPSTAGGNASLTVTSPGYQPLARTVSI